MKIFFTLVVLSISGIAISQTDPTPDFWLDSLYIRGTDTIITIKNNGRVGFNYTQPIAPLHILDINSSDDNLLLVESDGIDKKTFVHIKSLNAGQYSNELKMSNYINASITTLSFAPKFDFNQFRGTEGSLQPLVAGDFIGEITWNASHYVNNAIFNNAANIVVRTDDGNKTYMTIGTNELNGSQGSSYRESLVIDSDGDIGIGGRATDVAKAKLDFSTYAENRDQIINLYNSTVGANTFVLGLGMQNSSKGMRIYGTNASTDMITFGAVSQTDGATYTEFMRLDNLGNLGIGTATPSTKLEVSGTVTATAFEGDGSLLTGITTSANGIANEGSVTIVADSDSDNSGDIFFQTQLTTKMTIANDGNVGVGTTTPSHKLEVAGSLLVDGYIYFGDETVSGTWRVSQNAIDNLVFEKFDGAAWNIKLEFE